MKPETSAKLHKACDDLAKEITPYLTGFAPYTPVTVSQYTFAYQEPDRGGGSIRTAADIIKANRTAPKSDPRIDVMISVLSSRVKRMIEDELSDDGFSPYGSGPEPIGRREG